MHKCYVHVEHCIAWKVDFIRKDTACKRTRPVRSVTFLDIVAHRVLSYSQWVKVLTVQFQGTAEQLVNAIRTCSALERYYLVSRVWLGRHSGGLLYFMYIEPRHNAKIHTHRLEVHKAQQTSTMPPKQGSSVQGRRRPVQFTY